MVTSRAAVVAAAKAHIESGHSTLWGGHFMVKGSGAEVEDAAEWLADQFLGVQSHMPKKVKSSTNGKK